MRQINVLFCGSSYTYSESKDNTPNPTPMIGNEHDILQEIDKKYESMKFMQGFQS